jgi:two-component system sensor histidine kinase YesM
MLPRFFKGRIHRYIWNGRRSLKTTILWVFIPVIILFVCLVGVLTYTLAERQIRENAFVSINDTVTQTRNFLDYRLTSIFEQMVAFENDIDTLSLIKRMDSDRYGPIQPGDYIRVDRNLERIFTSYYSMLDSILLYFNEGSLMLSKKDYLSSRITFNYQDWRLRFYGNRSEYYWRTLHPNDVFLSTEADTSIASVFKLFGDDRSRLRGIILFNLKEEFFRDILEDAQISGNGSLILVNPEGAIRFKKVYSEYVIDGRIKQLLLNRREPSGQFTTCNTNGKKMIIIYDTVPINRWKLAAVLPEDGILNKVSFIKNITVTVVMILILTAGILSNLLANIVTTPLAVLTEKVKQVKSGNLTVPFDVDPPNEIGVLNGGIRELLERVRHLLDQVKSEQEQKRRAELDTLQSQIKPHFLYNTLDSIKQLCELGETREAGAMVAALAKFFRISISSGKEEITIGEEIEHIRNYLLNLQMRYDDQFEYRIDVEPELLSIPIIKLTLQQVVENAIYHGIKEKRGKGMLRISGYQILDKIIFEISDNGIGMDQATLCQIKSTLDDPRTGGRGYGLANVHTRLQLHYGKLYCLQIESIPGEGTTVRITIPARGGVPDDARDDCR